MTAGGGTEHAAVGADRGDPAPRRRPRGRHRRLVDTVGPQLGLAGRRRHAGHAAPTAGGPSPSAARGLTEGRTVYLAPTSAPTGAEVLVHELVHVAQQRARPARPRRAVAGRVRRALARPEAEARSIATAWRSRGEVLGSPSPSSARARSPPTAATSAPLPKPPATETHPGVAERAGLSEQQADTSASGLRQAAIGRVVQRRFAQERERIVDQLDGLWVDAGDVRNCLRILDTLPFLVARALVDSLPTSCKTDLRRDLDDEPPPHATRPPPWPRSSALAPILLRAIKAANVEGLDIRGFDDVAQRRAAWSVLHGLRRACCSS